MSPKQADLPSDAGNTIVVGVDGSAHSRVALRWAVEEAARTGHGVHAVLVWNPDPLFATPPPAVVLDEIESKHLATLTECIDQARGEYDDVVVTHAVCAGSAAQQLVSQAEGAAMLVLGSHGRSRMGTAFLGSVGTACVRHASCPVLIIPPHMTSEQADAAEAQQTIPAGPQQIAGPWL